VPTILTIATIAIAWGAWKGTTQTSMQQACTRIDKLESAAAGYPQAYMPRNETEARLRGIEDKLDIILGLVRNGGTK
jgi:hypothetical protein